MPLKIRTIQNSDFPDWLSLWDGNNLGRRDEAVTSETWTRLTNPDSPVNGFIAEKDGALVGLLHYILHPTTGSISHACYMQDVYVSEPARRQGIAKALIEALSATGKKEKWSRIYWLAEHDNKAAQSLYKALGQKLNFSLHVMPLS